MSRLERWSRLKRGEPEQTPASPDVPLSPEGDAQLAEPASSCQETHAGDTDAPEPGSLDHTLPDPDTLPPGSDIKAYLVSGVSAGLRKRALRRLFAASHYGVRDGLDDYDDDFRAKLQPLADDVAERLRQWTRQKPDDETLDDTADESSQAGSDTTDNDQVADRQAGRHEESPRDHDRARETVDDDGPATPNERVDAGTDLDQGSVCNPRESDQD